MSVGLPGLPDLTRKNTAHPVNLNIIIYRTTKIFSISLSPVLHSYTYTKGYLLKLKFSQASCILSDNYPLPQVLLSPASREEMLTCHQDVPMTLRNLQGAGRALRALDTG